MKEDKVIVQEDLQIIEKRREAKGRGERERYTQLKVEFQKIAKRETKSSQVISANRGKQENGKDKRSFFKKIGDTKGTFHTKIGTKKDKNSNGIK